MACYLIIVICFPRAIYGIGTDTVTDDKAVSHSIVLLDSPTNLFRNLILPLATTNETVMHMVLALSALSLAATGQPQYYPSALRHKQRSMRLIREQIASDAVSAANDANVIVILMLSVFEVIALIPVREIGLIRGCLDF